MKLITMITFSIIVYFLTLPTKQVRNAYDNWEIQSGGRIDIAEIGTFNDIDSLLSQKLCVSSLCNKRIHVKIQYQEERCFNVVFYKFCPFFNPIRKPSTKIYIDSLSFRIVNGRRQYKTSIISVLDSLQQNVSTGSNKYNYGIVWNRAFDRNEMVEFFRFMDYLYQYRFCDYVENKNNFYLYPVMFIELRDSINYESKKSDLPKIKYKERNDSVIILN